MTEKSCFKVEFAKDKSSFHLIKKACMSYDRIHHAVCTFKQRFMVVSGTRSPINQTARVEIYDSLNDSWKELPSLNTGRYRHASCSIVNSIYVFCGMD